MTTATLDVDWRKYFLNSDKYHGKEGKEGSAQEAVLPLVPSIGGSSSSPLALCSSSAQCSVFST